MGSEADYYLGVLVGAYLAMFFYMTDAMRWWMPLVWVASAAIFMGAIRLVGKLIARHRRRRNE